MRVLLLPRTWRAALRFSVLALALAFVCLMHERAGAQSCSFFSDCTAVYTTQQSTSVCFSSSSTQCFGNGFTTHISFGKTVDFWQPNPPVQAFGAHSATSGNCCTPDGFFNTGTMLDNTNYSFTFDGRSYGGGNLNAQTYNYFCMPHGAGMTGVLIVDPDGTTVSLGSNNNPSTYGQSVTFTATVNNNVSFFLLVPPTPTGTVTFYDNGIAISAPLTLISGSRTFTTSTLLGGSHNITATYTPANGNFTASSGGMTQTVNAANTSTTTVALNGGTNPTQVGQLVSFITTVSNASGTGVTPTGNVTFYDNGVAISGLVPLISGNGTFSTSALAGGTHPITAAFNANSNFNGSTSPAAFNEAVHDFSLSISNPVQSVLPNQTATFNGTLSAFGGYSSTIAVSCQGSPPTTCTGASVPLAANAQNVPFTVTASNPAVANFSFSISGSGVESLTRAVPVTLSVGSFSFSQPTPSPVSAVQGSPNDPSSPITFQISSLGSFAGEVDLNCPSPPAGVTCIFSNGASTQALTLSPGQVINDTLVLNTSSSVGVGAHSVTVQATPAAAPSQFQTRSVTLTETAGSGPASVTVVYFGPVANQNWPSGPIFQYLPTLEAIGKQYTFKISAVDYSGYAGCGGPGGCNNSTGVQMLIVFSEPVAASATVSSTNDVTDSCTTQNFTTILCNLHTIPYSPIWYKDVMVNVVPSFGRKVDVFGMIFSAVPNPGYPSCSGTYANNTCTIIHASTQTEVRPMLRPALIPGNNNPK